jgi:hypothetical protein
LLHESDSHTTIPYGVYGQVAEKVEFLVC